MQMHVHTDESGRHLNAVLLEPGLFGLVVSWVNVNSHYRLPLRRASKISSAWARFREIETRASLPARAPAARRIGFSWRIPFNQVNSPNSVLHTKP